MEKETERSSLERNYRLALAVNAIGTFVLAGLMALAFVLVCVMSFRYGFDGFPEGLGDALVVCQGFFVPYICAWSLLRVFSMAIGLFRGHVRARDVLAKMRGEVTASRLVLAIAAAGVFAALVGAATIAECPDKLDARANYAVARALLSAGIGVAVLAFLALAACSRRFPFSARGETAHLAATVAVTPCAYLLDAFFRMCLWCLACSQSCEIHLD